MPSVIPPFYLCHMHLFTEPSNYGNTKSSQMKYMYILCVHCHSQDLHVQPHSQVMCSLVPRSCAASFPGHVQPRSQVMCSLVPRSCAASFLGHVQPNPRSCAASFPGHVQPRSQVMCSLVPRSCAASFPGHVQPRS